MARKKAATSSRPRKRKINKSAAVREYLAANPNAKPKDVSEALAGKGIKLTPQAVSTIKFQAAKKGLTRRTGKQGTNGTVQVASLLRAKQFVSEMGGVEQAKHALDLLAQLT